jgi:hypothetical protein
MAAVLLPHLNGISNYFGLSQPQAQAYRAPSVGIAPQIQVPMGFGGGYGGGYGSGVSVLAADSTMFGAVRNAQREDREESRATTAAVVGGIATIALAGLSAFGLRSYCNDRKELQKAMEFKQILEQPNDLYGITVHQRVELTPVANKYIEILETKCGRSRNILILTGLALATGVAAFVGGMMSLKWLITASIISAVVVGSIAAFMIVWHCTDNTELPPAMARKVEAMQAQFNLEG